MNRVCDGANDCGQWEDEPKGLCNVNECAVNNGNCSHTCTDSKAGHRCGCRPGYKLLGNSICIGKYKMISALTYALRLVLKPYL